MARYRCSTCQREKIAPKDADGVEPFSVPCRAVLEVTDILAGDSTLCDGRAYRQDSAPEVAA